MHIDHTRAPECKQRARNLRQARRIRSTERFMALAFDTSPAFAPSAR